MTLDYGLADRLNSPEKMINTEQHQADWNSWESFFHSKYDNLCTHFLSYIPDLHLIQKN